MKETTRILHLADVHLDRPFVGLPREAAARRRADLWQTFCRCLEAARGHRADLVTIGGDLWEDENVTANTRASVAHELGRLAIPVLLICGNHDPLLPGGNYARTDWPPNVRVFDSGEPREHREDGVSVWGVSWTGGQLTADFLERFSVPDDGRVHLLLLHGTAHELAHLAPDGQGYCPFNPRRVLEIARLLDPTTREAPLLLDDPFDHFDDDRLRHGLELLAEVAAERQVVLFAEESDIVRRAREVCGDCDVLELPGPLLEHAEPAV